MFGLEDDLYYKIDKLKAKIKKLEATIKEHKINIPKKITPKEDKISRRRKNLVCDRCPPNKGENSKNRRKHGTKKPKYKNKRG